MRAAARRDDAACPRGERMKASTKANLAWRVDCEFGATQGKFDLAVVAKKNGLDAIHDTVHEMARDEARHICGLNALRKYCFQQSVPYRLTR